MIFFPLGKVTISTSLAFHRHFNEIMTFMTSFQFQNINNLSDDERLQSEWLEANGLGGWASSTISGCHSRRYHGLLVAAIKPPTERMVLISKLDETIVTANGRFELEANNYGEVIHPKGFQFLRSFTKN